MRLEQQNSEDSLIAKSSLPDASLSEESPGDGILRAAPSSERSAQIEIRTLQEDVCHVEETEALSEGIAGERTRQEARNLIFSLEAIAYKKHKVEETIRQLRREMEEARRQSRMSKLILLLGVAGLVFLFLDSPSWRSSPFFGALCLLAGLIASNQVLKVQTEAVAILSDAWDPKAIGALAMGMLTGDSQLRGVSRNALLKILPKAKASDAAFYDQEQMRALATLLETVSHRQDAPFQLALLKAFEQVGDAQMLDGVHNLTLSKNAQVRAAAETCLPMLQERVNLQKMNRSLLRPAISPAYLDSSESLLRPIKSVREETAQNDTLLRPASPE